MHDYTGDEIVPHEIEQLLEQGDERYALVFDLDGTLIPTNDRYREAEAVFAAWMTEAYDTGYRPPELKRKHREVQRELIDKNGGHRFGLYADVFVETYERVLAEIGEEPTEEGRAYARARGEHVTHKDEAFYMEKGFIGSYDKDAHPVNGADQVIETFAQQDDIDLYLVTKGSLDLQRPKVEGLELEDWFGDRIAIVKDDKKPVLTQIAAAYGPENSGMVGNSLNSDILPAQQLGMWQVYFPFEGGEPEDHGGVDLSHPGFSEIQDIEELVGRPETLIGRSLDGDSNPA